MIGPTIAKIALAGLLPFLGTHSGQHVTTLPAIQHQVAAPKVKAEPVYMYDAANPDTLPTGISSHDIIAYYNTGSWPWPQSAVNAWAKHHPMVAIDVNGSNPHDQILDIEKGDADPESAVAWVRARLALHPRYLPILYCDRNYYPLVVSAERAAGFQPGKDFKLWVSTANIGIRSFGNPSYSIGAQNDWQPGYDRSVIRSSGFVNAYGGGKG